MLRRNIPSICVLVSSLVSFVGEVYAQPAGKAANNWTGFRGPNANGVAPDNSGLPKTWTNTENVKWATDVPGWGWSCPIVWGDRVFLTTVVSDEKNRTPSKGLYLGQGVRDPAKGTHHWMVYCFDLNTGKELWKQEAHTGRPKVPRHPKSTYATETATTDGERLYVLFGDLGLYCFDLDGKPLWSRKFEPKKTFLDYGAAASPVVHGSQVIVVYDNLEQSWIAAFDSKTGDERWRTPRDEKRSWATPFVWKNEIRTEIVVPGRKRNRSYSLDGKLLWEFDGKMSNLVIPSPFAAHGLCYIASGYVGDKHRPTFAVRPGASGDITPDGDFENSKFIAWYQGQSSSYNPSQIVYGDYLYTLYDRGFLTCHDAKTGKQVYGKRRFSPGGSFTASPWACNGHLFFLSEDGLTYVVKAGPKFEIVETNDLDELCLASPAVAGDKLLIRTASRLYCITKGAKLSREQTAKDAGNVQGNKSIEEKTKVHRLAGSKRAVYDAFTYVNRIPERAEKGETASDMAGRIFGRLANQEGRILIKLPLGMTRESYLAFKTFFRYEGTAKVGNCAACHTPAEFTDLKSHVVTKGGSPKPTLSLRDLKKRKVDLRRVIADKIAASHQKRSGAADDIDDAYAKMNITKKDIPGLVAFLNLLDNVSDSEFHKLILNVKLLDTSKDIE